MIREKEAWGINGYLGIFVIIVLIGCTILSLLNKQWIFSVVCIIIAVSLATGLTLIHPNEAIVVTFFGKYIGSIRREGIIMTVPFTKRQIVSLRVCNFNSKHLKVNDVNGNPIEISAVIVFKIVDSSKAMFAVNKFNEFIEMQGDAALRAIVSKYPYDSLDESEITLRTNPKNISEVFISETEKRLKAAGVQVLDASITHSLIQ